MSGSGPRSTPLTNETFREFVISHRFVLVHFHAAWNGTDYLMERLLDAQSARQDYPEVSFATFDVDPVAHHALCRQHKVLNVPFLAFYCDGVLRRTVTGMQNAETIAKLLQEVVNRGSG